MGTKAIVYLCFAKALVITKSLLLLVDWQCLFDQSTIEQCAMGKGSMNKTLCNFSYWKACGRRQ